MPLQHDHILNPITALEFCQIPRGPLLILAGEGSFLKVFDAGTSKLLSQHNVLGDQAIHGIKTHHSGHGDSVQALVWGGSSLVMFRTSEFEKLLVQDAVHIQRPFEAPDWILDAILPPFDAWCAYLITAHNTVVKVKLGADDHVVVEMQASPSRSILYSAHLVCENSDNILVAAGTVFGEIVVWTCTAEQDVQVLYTFTGHEGSIFGVHISPFSSFQGGPSCRLLASCSDDRTIRIWKVATTHKRRESDGRLILTPRATNDSGENPGEDLCVATVMAHTSRIWRVKFLMNRESRANSDVCLLSFGEDSIAHQWSLDFTNFAAPYSETEAAAQVTTMNHTRTFASHSGKHIWSTAVHHKDESTLAILATGGADGKISFHEVESLVHMPSHEEIEYKIKFGEMPRAWPVFSEKIVIDSSWDLEQDILQPFSLPQSINDNDQEEISLEPAEVKVAHPDLVDGKAPKKKKPKKVRKDVFNKYAFISEDRLVLTTTFGRILLGSIGRDTNWEEIALPTSISEDIKSYSILLGISELGLAFFAGVSGKIYALTGDKSVLEVANVEGKVADMFKIYNSKTASFELLVTVLGSNCSTLFQVLVSTTVSLKLSAKYQLSENFVVTGAGRVDDLFVLGSRDGSLAIYNHTASHDMHQASSTLPVPVGDAITKIVPLARSSTDAGLSYFLATRRDGMYSIFTATTPKLDGTDDTIRCVHVGVLPFGPMVESAWYDQGNLLLYGFKSTKFIVWNETQQLEVMNVDCGGAHRNYAYSPIKNSSGGHFVYTKASKLYIHSQLTPSHTIVKRGGHGREIKACAVSPDGAFFATGAEDTAIRIWSYNDKASCPENEFLHQAIMQKHSAGIQHLQWHGTNYLLSSGGNEEFFIWSLSEIPGYGLGVICEATCPDQSEEQDLRIMSFDVADTTEGRMLISLAYSDSTIRVYTYSNESGFCLVSNGRYTSSCLTQVRHLHVTSEAAYLLTTATDGNISLWKVDLTSSNASSPSSKLAFIGTGKIHQSTIKCLDYTISNDSIIVVTGGDDNALGLSIYSMKGLTQQTAIAPEPTRYILRSAHAAAITGLCILPVEDVGSRTQIIKVVSSGNDQRVKEWHVKLGIDSERSRVVDIREASDEFTSVADVGDVAFLRSWSDGSTAVEKILIVGNGMEVWRIPG